MLFVCCLFEYWHKNFIHMQQTVVFLRKRKYSNYTLKSMSVKHRYIENMKFLSRLERTCTRTHASTYWSQTTFVKINSVFSVLNVNFHNKWCSKTLICPRWWYFFIHYLHVLYFYQLYRRKSSACLYRFWSSFEHWWPKNDRVYHSAIRIVMPIK